MPGGCYFTLQEWGIFKGMFFTRLTYREILVLSCHPTGMLKLPAQI